MCASFTDQLSDVALDFPLVNPESEVFWVCPHSTMNVEDHSMSWLAWFTIVVKREQLSVW